MDLDAIVLDIDAEIERRRTRKDSGSTEEEMGEG
jgi:hypothetical protein